MKKINFWGWFSILSVLLVIQFLYWYVYRSNVYAFFYSLKNSSHNVVNEYNGNLKLYSLNEDAIRVETIKNVKARGINIIVGPNFSSTGAKIFQFLEKYDLVSFSPSITSTKLLKQTNRIISMVPTNEYQIKSIMEFLKEKNVQKVLLVLDPFNKEYANEFLMILDVFEGKYKYFYTVTNFSENLDDYDAIVLTLAPKYASDFLWYFAKYYKGIILGTDSVFDEILNTLPTLSNFYIVNFGFKSYDWSNEAILKIFDILSKHKFISTNQFINFLLGHDIYDGISLTKDGVINKGIKIVNFEEFRKENR
ncbi:hypothetical protein SU69_08250 [Thermosipho melanesiensis]|uniref:Leucine-binding protein domain-containing protein n=1 Tax=Thermosipho melanesiensis TaxID=46541 RepID=A0ABN4UWL3_9BACT|nr:ABC transporter substrate-binding protein [Thermosipho melanesiensis]APT74528.1 hypothetical protein BW47_08610 [Thermosipho melanesiensis]OOC36480.1 hypothetical protein SU68_08320 [Thermosipho melanesiensis]OOC37298.1 hypothetical protein SU69_08250 [Thermosipho melanesiensis]OOC38051.1 hypothetical protein SU70_08260 [Thermosipho melanesiensis]OOC41278.1 hypothetical protein SU71_08245 [Thermosipho melanesiensis]